MEKTFRCNCDPLQEILCNAQVNGERKSIAKQRATIIFAESQFLRRTATRQRVILNSLHHSIL